MPSPLRRVLGTVLVAAVATTLAPSSAAPAGPSPGAAVLPDRLELPAGFQPEGIAIGPGPTAWFGSRVDGDIYEVDLVTGAGEVISEGPGTASLGMESDAQGRLFVAGATAGTARVVDTDTGDVLRSYQLTTGDAFVNDVVLTDDTAWFTDSRQAQLYAVPLGPDGTPAEEFRTLPLTGAWTQEPGAINANGVTETPDGSGLLVVNSARGELHRVDPATGATTLVDLGGVSLANGDGMLLRGRTLYVVQNRLDQVAVLRLDRAGTSGTLERLVTDPDFDVPTTVAAFGRWLYLPNARFSTAPTPETPYWVTRVER